MNDLKQIARALVGMITVAIYIIVAGFSGTFVFACYVAFSSPENRSVEGGFLIVIISLALGLIFGIQRATKG